MEIEHFDILDLFAIIVLIILIDHIFCNFDRLLKTVRMQNKHVNMSEQKLQYIYSITELNSAKLGITISEEVNRHILI